MSEINTMKCCAVREIHRLSVHITPQEMVMSEDFWTVFYHKDTKEFKLPCRYLLFSQANSPYPPRVYAGYGEKFKEFIEANGLGTVLETPFNTNPNSGNEVRLYIWTLDEEPIRQYLLAHNLVPRVAPPVEPVATDLGPGDPFTRIWGGILEDAAQLIIRGDR